MDGVELDVDSGAGIVAVFRDERQNRLETRLILEIVELHAGIPKCCRDRHIVFGIDRNAHDLPRSNAQKRFDLAGRQVDLLDVGLPKRISVPDHHDSIVGVCIEANDPRNGGNCTTGPSSFFATSEPTTYSIMAAKS